MRYSHSDTSIAVLFEADQKPVECWWLWVDQLFILNLTIVNITWV